MFIHSKDSLEPVGGTETPQDVYLSRRKWLRAAGFAAGAGVLAGGGYLGWRSYRGSDEEVIESGRVALPKQAKAAPKEKLPEAPDDGTYEDQLLAAFPAERDARFEYGRDETDRAAAARYTNFYEFSSYKYTWRYVDDFDPYPWEITIDGLCRNPMKLDVADFQKQYADFMVERQYRHRCVETWAMAVPWTGVPLAKIIQAADPLPQATHVRFVSFMRPEEAPQQQSDQYPWPYTEGLTIAEATNELALLATGIYGQPLLKQHGAPIRTVIPWKYGFKSAKSIQRIEFVNREPETFWTTLMPDAYPFESNVEPQVPRPWPQSSERMLGSNEVIPTQLYNGYADYVADLYKA
jgi:sulfoxide reductase catalytic subunit YedY